MSANKHLLRFLLPFGLLVATGLVLWHGYSRPPVTVFHQSSRVLTDKADPFHNRNAAPLSRQGEVRQRLWLPNATVDSITLYSAAKTPLPRAPSVEVLADDNGAAGDYRCALAGTVVPRDGLYVVRYDLPELCRVWEDWIWLRLTQDLSPTALRLVREIDDSLYPGGVLQIDDPPRYQQQGVLAFRLSAPGWQYDPPLPALLLVLGLVTSLMVAKMPARLSLS